MKLIALLENTACRADVAAEHGLSLYLEVNGRKVLFDAGPGASVLANADALGVDLSAVDTAVLSHGHNDHGGGMPAFLSRNDTAPLYVYEGAFAHHMALREGGVTAEIGVPEQLHHHPQVRLCRGVTELGDGLTLFADIEGTELVSATNRFLLEETNGTALPDPFLHEQNLAVQEGEKLYLLAGCAHRGVWNIMERFAAVMGRMPDVVVGGFHLSAPGRRNEAPTDAFLDELSRRLLDSGAQFYTCHCTGAEAFEQLQQRMGQRVQYLHGGQMVEL